MKKIVILVFFLIAVGTVWLLFSARIRIDMAAMRYDPSALKLRLTYPNLIRSTLIPDHIQTGLVMLPDGENVKFWFISHHITGPGCVRFDFSDGTRKYIYGSYFCCEVQIPEGQVKNKRDLVDFIERHNES